MQQSRRPDARRLVLVRHAEAEQSGATDADRALTESGGRDAEAAGGWLTASGVTPEHVIVSAARRAQETWAALARGGGWSIDPDVSRLLYSAEPETVLDLVREVPDEAGVVVVVGHNPTVAYLAQMVDDGLGSTDASVAMTTGGFPPCSLAVFDYDGSWSELDVTSARLVTFHVGKA